MDAVTTLRPAERPVVRLRNLAFGYPGDRSSIVLHNLDLDVGHGEFIALVGKSGVGKSTLLRVIAGLAPPVRGTVEVEPAKEPGSRPLGLVFQDARLLPWRKVVANVEYGLEGLVRSRQERRARALDALRLVGLGDYVDRWPHQLSGGQRQRVGIARALALRPKLLLMDEPFGALDPVTRLTLQDELLAIWRNTGASIVFVTHDLDEATYLADRVILLGGSPAHIVREFSVDAPRPRARDRHRGESGASALHVEVYETFTAAAQ
ncbi:ABC transporter ATP-binding protein [Methylopila musalis]|uniref:ABC transporter ATP-binding protein n=1 Tax=Methylopila musalis TaxID=1134781 RepID=A0ABW3Z369_9HYPH